MNFNPNMCVNLLSSCWNWSCRLRSGKYLGWACSLFQRRNDTCTVFVFYIYCNRVVKTPVAFVKSWYIYFMGQVSGLSSKLASSYIKTHKITNSYTTNPLETGTLWSSCYVVIWSFAAVGSTRVRKFIATLLAVYWHSNGQDCALVRGRNTCTKLAHCMNLYTDWS